LIGAPYPFIEEYWAILSVIKEKMACLGALNILVGGLLHFDLKRRPLVFWS